MAVEGGVPKDDALEAMGMEPEMDDEESAQRLFIGWMQVHSPSSAGSCLRRVRPG